jgi:hypothetical protein
MCLGKRRGAKPTALQAVKDNSLHTVLKKKIISSTEKLELHF